MSGPHVDHFSPHRKSRSLDVHLLGVVDFDSAVQLQKHLVYDVSGRNDTYGSLLLCEHPPVITVGREGSREDLLLDDRELTSRQLEVRWLNRGGGNLVHAPGQLAVYPILPLDRLGVGLTEFRTRMETTVVAMGREMHVATWPGDHAAGVQCRCGQFAFLGAAVKSWVSYFGMYVNVSPDMSLQRTVRSAPEGERVTSLAAQRLRPTSMHAVRESLVRHLAAQFEYEQVHLSTGHPLLKRTRRNVHVPA